MKFKFLIFYSLFVSHLLYAGYPCPIDVNMYEAKLSWRDNSADLAMLKTKQLWLGISYREEDNHKIILVPRADSPAYLAGVKKNDVLVSINGVIFASQDDMEIYLDKALNTNTTKPITFNVLRGQKPLSIKVIPTYKDPLFMGLFNASDDTECLSKSIEDLTVKQKKIIEEAIIDKNKGFRCNDAHKDKKLKKEFETGSLIMARGEKRVIFVMPNWQTTCVDVALYDNVSKEQLETLMDTITKKYTEDRWRNP